MADTMYLRDSLPRYLPEKVRDHLPENLIEQVLQVEVYICCASTRSTSILIPRNLVELAVQIYIHTKTTIFPITQYRRGSQRFPRSRRGHGHSIHSMHPRAP